MRQETRRIVLPVSAAVAFDFVADYSNDPEWRSEILSATLVSGVRGEAGARYMGDIEWYGVQVSHELEVVECRRPTHIHVRSQSPSLQIDVRYDLEDQHDRCLLSAEYTLEMEGALALVEPFGWALLTGWVNEDLPRLPKTLAAVL